MAKEPISLETLQIAAEILIGMKGQPNDWIADAKDVANSLEIIARKLDDLREGR